MITKTLKTSDKRGMFYLEFETPKDFFDDTMKSRKLREYSYGIRDFRSWCGSENYEEALKLLNNGLDTKSINQISKNIIFNQEYFDFGERNTFKQFRGVVGNRVNVPAFMAGVPKQMIQTKISTHKQKILNLLIDVSCSEGMNNKIFDEWLAKILASVNSLEKNGYRCRINLLTVFSQPNELIPYCVMVEKIKKESEIINLQQLSRFFNTTFFRFWLLDIYAREDGLMKNYFKKYEVAWGHGRALYAWDNDKRDIVLNAIPKDNEKLIYINYYSNLKEAFKGLD